MKKKVNKSLIMNTIFLGFTLCIYAPLELYLSNYHEFWFSLSLFSWIPICLGMIAILAAIMIGHCLREDGRLVVLFEALLFGVGIASYIQGNFLNLKLGVMNGAIIEWEQYRLNFVVNTIIWIAILIIVMVAAFKATPHFKKFSFGISLLFTLTQLVSLIALLIPYLSSEGWNNSKASYFVSDRGLYEVGEEENIVVFLLDMFDDNYFKTILETNPAIKTQLDGFTYFSNFTGSYSTTYYSLNHLSTGKYFYNETDLHMWVSDVSRDKLYFNELLDDGYQLNVYSSPSCFPKQVVEHVGNYEYAPWAISSKRHFTCDIYQLVMCKYFPNAMKPYIWMTGNEFDNWKQFDSDYRVYGGETDNRFFYRELLENGVSVQGSPKQYKFIHLMGTHYPYGIDENANPVSLDNDITGEECARGVLKIVNDYLENLKQLNCYDNTAVVIMADHGYYWDGVLSNPVFLVKPKASRGELQINTAPTCQGDFAPTILELADLNQDSSYGESVFDIPEDSRRERLFYQYYLQEKPDPDNGNRRLIEYRAGYETNSTDKFELTDVEYTTKGEKISHSKYCQTCQDGTLPDDSYDPPRLVHEQASNYPK